MTVVETVQSLDNCIGGIIYNRFIVLIAWNIFIIKMGICPRFALFGTALIKAFKYSLSILFDELSASGFKEHEAGQVEYIEAPALYVVAIAPVFLLDDKLTNFNDILFNPFLIIP
jgi:hypothetical protein